MDGSCLARHFEECRLPLAFLDSNPNHRTGHLYFQRRRWRSVDLRVDGDHGFFTDVRTEGRNEKFVLFIGKEFEVEILDEDLDRRHILLMAKNARVKRRYLFGHDERHLFVLKLQKDHATSLAQAFKELKPAPVIEALEAVRKVIRQGEWFFVPVPEFVVPKNCAVRRKVPVGRGGRPHIADELVRVQSRDSRDRIVTGTYVRGKVRHRDHSTLELEVWHRVHGNTEDRSSATVRIVD